MDIPLGSAFRKTSAIIQRKFSTRFTGITYPSSASLLRSALSSQAEHPEVRKCTAFTQLQVTAPLLSETATNLPCLNVRENVQKYDHLPAPTSSEEPYLPITFLVESSEHLTSHFGCQHRFITSLKRKFDPGTPLRVDSLRIRHCLPRLLFPERR